MDSASDEGISQYLAMIGAGGVGSGCFFALEGNHTLGREESRAGYFLDRQDYCKLHIISHYVKTLTGPGFAVIPVSKVGDDEAGQRLLEEMTEAGLDTRYMAVSRGDATLYSICFLYPDGSGGNLTTANAATAKVDPPFIESVESEFFHYQGKGIALAAPEVSLEARLRLLELGTQYGFYRAASMTSGELLNPQASAILNYCDLLAINRDEAVVLAGIKDSGQSAQEIGEQLIERIQRSRPSLSVSITAGKEGSWCWDKHTLSYVQAYPVEAVGTAGAGDAHLAGILAGLVGGLSFQQAHQLGALTAAFSVTSPHTIHKGLGKTSLLDFIDQNGISAAPHLVNYLQAQSANLLVVQE